MNFFGRIFLFSFLLGLFGFSCSKTKSDAVNTQAWNASYEVKSETSRAICEAKYQVGSGSAATFIELTSGDYVDCNGVAMIRADSVVGEVIYKTAVPTSNLYTITLHRKGEQNYMAIVPGPAEFSVSQPVSNQVLPKQRDLRVNWSVSASENDRMLIYLTFSEPVKTVSESSTKFRSYSQVKETGSFTIAAAETPGGVGALENGQDVSASLQMTRVHVGVMPEGLEGKIIGSRTSTTNLIFR